MGSLFRVLKINLKAMIKTLPLIIVMYIALPAILAIFSSVMFNALSANQVKADNIVIENNCETIAGKNLIEYLKSENLKEYFTFNQGEKADIKLIIPKNYGSEMKSLGEKEIVIEKGENSKFTEFLKNEIKAYSNKLAIKGNKEVEEKFEQLNNQSVIEGLGIKENQEDQLNNTIGKEKENSLGLGANAIGFIGMLLGMFIASSAQGEAVGNYKTLRVRINTSPNSKNKLYFYNLLEGITELLIILIAYVMFFKGISNAFSGNIFILFMMIFATTLITVSLSRLLRLFINPTWNTVVTMIIMITTTIGGFSNIASFKIISKINPFTLVIKMFENISSMESIKILGFLILISIVIILISLIKINFKDLKRKLQRGRA